MLHMSRYVPTNSLATASRTNDKVAYLGPCQNDLPGNKDQQDDLRFDHPIYQTGEDFWLVAAMRPPLICGKKRPVAHLEK